jgi:DNA modification methylase
MTEPQHRTIYCGDALAILHTWPDNCIDMCVTSPPYLGLRDYGLEPTIWDGDPDCDHRWIKQVFKRRSNDQKKGDKQSTNTGANERDKPILHSTCAKCGAWYGCYGLEPTVELYVKHSVAIFEEVRRVLKPSGLLFLNLGDTYASGKGSCYNPGGGSSSLGQGLKDEGALPMHRGNKSTLEQQGYKPKDLLGIPYEVVRALRMAGWYWRSDIIDAKPNPMPESVEDRPTKSYEHIFMLSKSGNATCWKHRETGEWVLWPAPRPAPDYRWRHRETGEIISTDPADTVHWRRYDAWKGFDYYYDAKAIAEVGEGYGRSERFRGSSYTGNNSFNNSAKDEHSTGGGKASYDGSLRNARDVWTISTEAFPLAHFATFPRELPRRCILAGCKPGGLVLDCFFGSGTTGLVAEQLGRRWCGIELNPEYAEMARQRTAQRGLFSGEGE